MAVEYAASFAPVALEQFSQGSLTQGVFSAKYDWTGAKTVTVSSITPVALADYARTGSTRFGTVNDAATTHQHMEVDKERAFAAVVDGLDTADTMGSLNAGAFLREQIATKIVPDVDGYRFGALFTAAPTAHISATAAITSANAYSSILAGNVLLDEDDVPRDGRVVFVSPQTLNFLKLDANFVKASDLAQGQVVFNGQVGSVDGNAVVMVPNSRLNATDNHIDFVIVHPDAVAAPVKLSYYNVTSNPPGVYGSLIEGLVVHDCFLLDTKKNGIYVHVHA